MALLQLPTVFANNYRDSEYKQIHDILNKNFLDVSQIINRPPSNLQQPFYWIIYSEQELIQCLDQYPKGCPIGYRLLSKYIKIQRQSKHHNDNKHSLTLNYLAQKTQCLFEKFVICTTGIHNNIKINIKAIVNAMGGKYDGNYTENITHLIENQIGSAKHIAAAGSNGKCKIATTKWIYDCYLNGSVMDHKRYCPPFFHGVFLSVTGIEPADREAFKQMVHQFGGEYCQGLTQQCSHLIANDENCLNNEKCKAAQRWNIPILKKEWFNDYLKSKGCVDYNDYLWIKNEPGLKKDNENENDNQDDMRSVYTSKSSISNQRQYQNHNQNHQRQHQNRNNQRQNPFAIGNDTRSQSRSPNKRGNVGFGFGLNGIRECTEDINIEEDTRDIDRIGEDTECQNLYHMIDQYDEKQNNDENQNGKRMSVDNEDHDGMTEIEEDTLEDACYLENCVILLLCLDAELHKEVFIVLLFYQFCCFD